MRTFDRQYLATHPLGDEKAEFTLSVNVPDSAGVPLNPDGSKPQVTLKVTADTYQSALTLLVQMHEDHQELVGTWLGQQLSVRQYRKAIKMADRGEKPAFVQEAADKIHAKFLTFETSVAFTTEEDGVDTEHTVDLAITAPSVTVGMKGFIALTRPHSLNELAITFCPELEGEEYGYANEVMVFG